MVILTGELQWRDMDSSGRTAWEDKEGGCPLCERAGEVHGAFK